jgi:hypothetical protein
LLQQEEAAAAAEAMQEVLAHAVSERKLAKQWKTRMMIGKGFSCVG